MRYILKGDQFEGQGALQVSPAAWERSSHETLLSQMMTKTEGLLGNRSEGENQGNDGIEGLNRKGQQVKVRKK